MPDNMVLTPPTELQDAITERAKQVMNDTGYRLRTAINLARADLIDLPVYGISFKNQLSRLGFTTSLDVHCDHCEDGETCRFFRPECCNKFSASTCNRCFRTNKHCTINHLPPSVKTELRRFEYFRRVVPCHQCWELKRDCDARKDVCGPCKGEGSNVCIREMCVLFDEPAEACKVDCDRAHIDDGYQNVTEYPRDVGSNAY
jgi:hypothetical protein